MKIKHTALPCSTKRTHQRDRLSALARRSSYTRLSLETLEDRTVPDGALATAVGNQLTNLQNGLNALVRSSANLPILNSPLQSVAATVNTAFTPIRNSLLPVLNAVNSAQSASTIQTRIYQALYSPNPSINLLHDINGNGFLDDVSVSRNAANGDLTISLNVQKTVNAPDAAFGLGLPGMPLFIRSGSVQVSAGIIYDHLIFVQHSNNSVAFDTTSFTDELQAAVSANLSHSTTIRGSLGFMEISARDRGTTGLNLSLITDVTPSGPINPRLTGLARVDLDVKADFTGNNVQDNFKYPGITTNLYMNWNFLNASTSSQVGSFGNDPVIEFRNVNFAVGTFLSNVLEPIVDTVHQVTKYLSPILDILNTDIPGLSDVTQAAGLGSFSLESMAKLISASHTLPPDYQLILDLVTTVDDISTAISSISQGSNGFFVPVGTFSLAGSDIRNSPAIDFFNGLNNANLTDLIPIAVGALTNVEDEIPGPLQKLFHDTIDPFLKSANNGAGFEFPLLEDPRTGVFKLLLGQDVDFVNFTARFHLSASYRDFIDLWGPVKARLSGEVDADAYFKMGYDTFGLRQFLQNLVQGNANAAVLANGLYFDSTQDLLHMSGSISAGAAFQSLPLYVVPTPFGPVPVLPDVSVNGTVSADNVSVRWGTSDPKFRFFVGLPEPLFQTSGLIKAGFNFVVEAGIPGIITIPIYTHTLADTTLLDLYNGPLANPGNPLNQPPDQPPPPQEVTMDLSGLPVRMAGFIPLPYTIRIEVVNGRARFLVSGRQYVSSLPLSQVASVRVIGSDAADLLTVVGALNRPVSFEGGLGLNTVALDDSASSGANPRYTVTSDDIKRINSLGTVDVKFIDSNYVGLRTVNRTGASRIQIQDLYNTNVNLTLGQATNLVTVDTTTGGIGDIVNIDGSAGLNTLLVADRDESSDGLVSGPATYTIDTTFDVNQHTNKNIVTNHSITRSKRQFGAIPVTFFQYQYTASTTINYDGISTASIDGGDLGNTFNVKSTDPDEAYILTGGSGVDTFMFGARFAHLGFVNSNVSVDGGTGRDDQLLLDDTADDSAAYSVASTYKINGNRVQVHSDVTAPQGTLSTNGNYTYQNIEHLNLKGGGPSTWNVNNTPLVVNQDPGPFGQTHNDGDTQILGGSSTDIVNILGTTGTLTVDAGAGYNSINVGTGFNQTTGRLDNIRGAVTFQGQQPDAINDVVIRDSSNTQFSTYVLDATRLLRKNNNGIPNAAPINFGNLRFHSLNIFGDSGGDIFQVNDTPGASASSSGVSLFTGSSNDTVYVHATSDALSIDLGGGTFQGLFMGDASQSLDAIRGNVTVTGGAGFVFANLSNAISTNGGEAIIDSTPFDAQTLKRYKLVDNQYVLETSITFGVFNRVLSSLTYQPGMSGEVTYVQGNPTGSTITLQGNPGAVDAFSVRTDLDPILGPVTVVGQPGDNDYAFYYDYQNLQPVTYDFTINPNSPQRQVVNRTGTGTVRYDNLAEVIFYSGLGGNNTVNVQGIAANQFLNTVEEPGDVVTVGTLAPNTGGTLSNLLGILGVVGQDVDVTIDDSGNTDTASRTVQFTTPVNQYDPGNHIVGLAAQPIFWRLDASSSLHVLGGAGNETFVMGSTDFEPAISINGGGGVNTLDYSPTAGQSGLVAWYAGEGDANDVLGNHSGTAYNGVSYVPGVVGQAFSFDGIDDYVQVPNAASLEPSTVTVEAWVNSTNVGRNQYVLSKGVLGYTAASYAIYSGDNSGLRFYVSTPISGYLESPDAGTGVWDGQWHHVIGTFDGIAVRLYVDGQEVGNGTSQLQSTGITYALPDSNDLFIGTYGINNGTAFKFKGLVDEPSVYNRALSSAEVQKLYSGGKSSLLRGVNVNLQLATATDLRGGIANIQNVVGSAGNDIIVGNGNNRIDGGLGRDVLIGGIDPSFLIGGGDDDILIAGTTDYDTNDAALKSIMDEWSRGDIDYATRMAHLVNGNGVPVLNASTVHRTHADASANQLTGGLGKDLFFAQLASELVDWNSQQESWIAL